MAATPGTHCVIQDLTITHASGDTANLLYILPLTRNVDQIYFVARTWWMVIGRTPLLYFTTTCLWMNPDACWDLFTWQRPGASLRDDHNKVDLVYDIWNNLKPDIVTAVEFRDAGHLQKTSVLSDGPTCFEKHCVSIEMGTYKLLGQSSKEYIYIYQYFQHQ